MGRAGSVAMRDLRREEAGGDAEGRGSTWVHGTGILDRSVHVGAMQRPRPLPAGWELPVPSSPRPTPRYGVEVLDGRLRLRLCIGERCRLNLRGGVCRGIAAQEGLDGGNSGPGISAQGIGGPVWQLAQGHDV
jgi:hypothetical protein